MIPTMRSLTTRCTFFLAALLVFSIAALPLEVLWAQAETSEPQVVVTAGASGVRLWDEEGALVAEFGPGARLTATQRSTDGGWLYVQADDGSEGWAPTAGLIVFNVGRLPPRTVNIRPITPTPPAEPTAPPAPAGATQIAPAQETPQADTAAPPSANGVTAQVALQRGNLNIRSGPGAGYAIIGRARAGQQLAVLGRNTAGDWVQVAAPGTAAGSGWVAAQFIAVNRPVSELPIIQQTPAAGEVRGENPPVQEGPPAASAAGAAPPPLNPPLSGGDTGGGAAGLSGKLVLQTAWGGDIYVYHLATGELRLLTGGFDPSISPDGAQVAFTRLGGEHGLYLINIDGSNERRIFSERNEFFSPKWSPDGQSIVFMRTDSTYDCERCIPEELRRKFPWYRVRPRLARVDANGQNYLDIASLDTATAPDWNSAGVVYSSEAGIQITTATSRDENRRVIFDIRQQYYQDPDWQPGGGRIVYQQRRAGRWALFAINPDGSGRVELNPPPTALVDAMPSNVSPAWSPDGRHIVFLSNRAADNSAGAWGVWVMDADGGNARRLPIDLPFEYNYVDEQMIDWGP